MTTTSPSEPRAIAEAEGAAVDLVEARRYGEHAMRKLRDLAAARAVIEQSHAEQVSEIEAWFAQETARLDGETERLKLTLRPLVEALVQADPLAKRSVEFTAGRAGFRAGRERVVVDDAAACLAWLEEAAPELVRTKKEPDLAGVKKRMAEGERFPGVSLQRGELAYFVEPIGTAPS